MYICICQAVTEKEIRRAAANGADSIYELQDSLGVATCCGGCTDRAEAILDETRPQRAFATPAMYIPSVA